jgi:hypothetical protein
MLAAVLRAAGHVWVAIPKWEECCRPYAFGRRIPFTWLPVVSNIAACKPANSSAVRARYAPAGRFLIGHFGTCGGEIGTVLRSSIPKLLENHVERAVLLIGRDGQHLRNQLLDEYPGFSDRVYSTGDLSSEQASLHISACDVMLQPYPDGVSSRRGSFMAPLSHGKPIATTSGPLTEPLWSVGNAIKMVQSGNLSGIVDSVNDLLADPTEMVRLGMAAQRMYSQRFGLPVTVNLLRNSVALADPQNSRLPA